MNKNIVIASNNNGKKKELMEILKGYNIFTLEELGISHDTIEDGDTLSENSLKKAKEIKEKLDNKWMVLADDSGLFIKSLNNEPGVYTSRYSEINGVDVSNMNKSEIDLSNMNLIINKIKSKSDRSGVFITNLCLISHNNQIRFFEGKLDVIISNEIRGENGFGYDSILEYKGRTLAEMTSHEKNLISHRRKALDNLKEFLDEYNNLP